MMRRAFTLIELMIVIAIIAIVAAIAVPNLLESRITANESAASTSLKSGVFPAQVQWRGGAYQDSNSNTIGEYGTLEYLAGINDQSTSEAAGISLLSGQLATGGLNANTREAHGYRYAAFVPNEDGTGILVEGQNLPPNGAMTANDAERIFFVTAGPDAYSQSGRRVFLLSSDGLVRSPAGANAAALRNTWYAVNPPVAGTGTTAASLRAGLNTALATADDLRTRSPTFITDYPPYGQ